MDRVPAVEIRGESFGGARTTLENGAPRPVDTRDRYASTTLDKAFGIIDALAGPSQSLVSICDRTGLNKTTVLRLLRILESKGFVARTGDGYSLGHRFYELAFSRRPVPDLPSLCRPLLKELQARLGGSVHLGLYDAGVVVCLDALPDETSSPEAGIAVGTRLDAHASALGKALLALLPDSDIRRRYGTRALPARTAWTITDLSVLLQDLRAARRQGVAFDAGEYRAGMLCWAVALGDLRERPLCAVSLSYRKDGPRPGDATVRAELDALRGRLRDQLAAQDIHSLSLVGGSDS